VNEYGRQDVLRIFRICERQLRLWERSGLIASGESYSFQDLGQLRKLRDLGARRISASSILNSIHAMRSVCGMADPLLEAGMNASGSRVTFRHSGLVMEPIARQLLLDFEGEGARSLVLVATPVRAAQQRELEVARLFVAAVRAEEAGRREEAMAGYEAILCLCPLHAAACINLGTLFYNQQEYLRAEQLYRMATEADPEYALAFFDLGNVLDELRRLPEAVGAYQRAVGLAPRYADAHYNLALALERSGERRRALPHWLRYLKLDAKGPWAEHARIQMRKTLAREGLKVAYRAEGGTAAARSLAGARGAAGRQEPGKPGPRLVEAE
jgi:tetratricopeptide (TPR) repeat protein